MGSLAAFMVSPLTRALLLTLTATTVFFGLTASAAEKQRQAQGRSSAWALQR